MTKHSINRNGATANSTDDQPADDEDTESDDEEQRSEAEIKRELRKSVVGRAILDRHRELKNR
jgi:hypothetical protein